MLLYLKHEANTKRNIFFCYMQYGRPICCALHRNLCIVFVNTVSCEFFLKQCTLDMLCCYDSVFNVQENCNDTV